MYNSLACVLKTPKILFLFLKLIKDIVIYSNEKKTSFHSPFLSQSTTIYYSFRRHSTTNVYCGFSFIEKK